MKKQIFTHYIATGLGVFLAYAFLNWELLLEIGVFDFLHNLTTILVWPMVLIQVALQ